MAIIVQYDIFLKYCQRGFCPVFMIIQERTRYILLRNHKTTQKGVYFEQGIECRSQYFEGNITMIHTQKLKTITKHIFSFFYCHLCTKNKGKGNV